MRCVVQRVKEASVTVAGETVGKIGPGYMVLIGVRVEDTEKEMNLSLKDVGGEILAVSQFTLYGDARGGRRPSFIAAARPEVANELYEQLVASWREQGIHVETGRFRTHMEVGLVNDGPVTILLDSMKGF